MITPELWDHQIRMIDAAVRRDNYAFLAEPGTGKTRTSIEVLRRWYTGAKRVMRTLIFCPPAVIINWQREIQRFSKVGHKVVCLTGSGTQRCKAFAAADPESIFVTNYESTGMPELFEMLLAWKPEVLIADEVHRCKSLQAKRTKQVIKLADLAVKKLILTGTPILNSPLDLFAQFRILDGGATFGKNFFLFRAEHFEDKNARMPAAKHFPNWVLRPGALEALNKKLDGVSMVVKKSECLDLPPLVKQTITVELGKEQRRLYDTLKKDFIAYLGDKACVANLAITKALRMQQIVSGYVTLEGENGEDRANVSLKENPRAEALRELLEDIAPVAKCIVWLCFRQDYALVRAICEKLGLPYVELHGEIAPKARQAAIDRFNTEEDCRVFIGHPASGGVGISLIAASHSITYSRNFSLENQIQSEARNFRAGSERHAKITQIDICAANTIDELVTKRLAQKQQISDKVLLDFANQL